MEKRLRFKTVEEFEKEHGKEWRGKIRWNTGRAMDHLCGTEVPPGVVANMQDDNHGRSEIKSGGERWIVKLSNTVPLEEPSVLAEDSKAVIIKPDYSGDPDFLLAPIKCDF
jgi:hypothetical protein